MMTSRLIASMFLIIALGLGAGTLLAQDYPTRPVRIVASEPGGGANFISRLIGQGISPALGQPVIVDNRGSAILPAIYVAKAIADGYTLLCSSSVIWIGSLLQKVPYDPVRDFSPITLAVSAPNVLVVHPSLPVTSVKDLIALAKARPNQLNYGSAGNGGSAHLSAELFKSMAGVNITMIPYNGSGPSITALIANEVQTMFATAPSSTAHIQSGKVKALAVTSATPSALVPGVPTVAASGLPGYESATNTGFFVPTGTPEYIIRRLNQEITRVLAMPDVKEKFLKSGVETVGNTPAQYALIRKTEITQYGKVIRDAGIHAD